MLYQDTNDGGYKRQCIQIVACYARGYKTISSRKGLGVGSPPACFSKLLRMFHPAPRLAQPADAARAVTVGNNEYCTPRGCKALLNKT